MAGTISTATTLNGIPVTYGDVRTNPDLVIERLLKYDLYFRSRNRYPMVSLLELTGRGRYTQTSEGKRIAIPYGDTEPETAVLTAGGYGFHTGVPVLTIDFTAAFVGLPVGTLVMLKEVIAGNWNEAIVRLDTAVAGVPGRYNCAPISCLRDGAAYITGVNVPFTAAAVVDILSNFSSWDGQANPGSYYKPDLMYNYIQHSRETLTVGKWGNAEQFYTDQDIQRMANIKMDAMLCRVDRQLNLNGQRINPASFTGGLTTGNINTIEGAIAAGFPFFLCPGLLNPSAADVSNNIAPLAGVRGVNHVNAAATFDYTNINRWMNELTRYGSDTKYITGSPASLSAFKAALAATTPLQMVGVYNFPGTTSMWEAPSYQLDSGRVVLIPNHNLNGAGMHIVGNNSGATLTAENATWVMAVDPEFVAMTYLNTKDGGTQMTIKEVAAINADTSEKREVSVGFGLAVAEPRAMGYLGTSGT